VDEGIMPLKRGMLCAGGCVTEKGLALTGALIGVELVAAGPAERGDVTLVDAVELVEPLAPALALEEVDAFWEPDAPAEDAPEGETDD